MFLVTIISLQLIALIVSAKTVAADVVESLLSFTTPDSKLLADRIHCMESGKNIDTFYTINYSLLIKNHCKDLVARLSLTPHTKTLASYINVMNPSNSRLAGRTGPAWYWLAYIGSLPLCPSP